MSRVAVTGIGVVAPGAIGVDAFRAQLATGQSTVRDIERFDTSGLSAHKAALVTDFKARDFIAPMKLRRMNVPSRYGLAAAKLALIDAGVDVPQLAQSPIGVAFGTAFGPVQTSVEYMQEYVEKGAALAPPQLFPESVANAPGSHIAIDAGFRGFNVTLTQRESSVLAAAMYAGSQIVKKIVPGVIVGGVDEVNEMIFSVLDRLGALAHADDRGDEASRPFDRNRNGLVLGEGAAALLVEDASVVSARAKVYGWLSGFGIARDVSASISSWGDGVDAVVRAMRAAIDDANVRVDEIDAIYASANSTLRADRLEYRAIEALFGEQIPPVVATKGIFGEYAGGGALQLAAAMLALSDDALPASPGFEEGDAGMRLNVTRNRTPCKARNVLINTLSAGGGIICAVASREAA